MAPVLRKVFLALSTEDHPMNRLLFAAMPCVLLFSCTAGPDSPSTETGTTGSGSFSLVSSTGERILRRGETLSLKTEALAGVLRGNTIYRAEVLDRERLL